jgi:hypothetical protein
MNTETGIEGAPAIAACEGAVALLRIIAAGGAHGEAELFIQSTESMLGLRRTINRPLVESVNPLDDPILTALEECDQTLHARVALFDRGGSARRLAALAVSFTIPRRVIDGEVLPPAERWRTIGALIAGCPKPPTIIVAGSAALKGAGDRLGVVWALQRPLDLDGPLLEDGATPIAQPLELNQRYALTAVQRLAFALGADMPASLDDLTIDLPGSVIREGPCDTLAECLVCEPARIYELEDLMTAIVEYAEKGQAQ